MKSIFVVSERFVKKHIGEEYDSIIEVVHEPTTENILSDADKIADCIHSNWRQEEGKGDRKIVIYLDAAAPFASILINLKIIMKQREGIEIELPWDKPQNLEELDNESKEMLKNLN